MIIALDPYGIASYSQVHIANVLPPGPPLKEWNQICPQHSDTWNALCDSKEDNVKKCEG